MKKEKISKKEKKEEEKGIRQDIEEEDIEESYYRCVKYNLFFYTMSRDPADHVIRCIPG